MLAYGVMSDFVDEYPRIAKTIAMESLKLFVKVVVPIISYQYLRSPANHDIAKLLTTGQIHGFLGIMEGIVCMHYK